MHNRRTYAYQLHISRELRSAPAAPACRPHAQQAQACSPGSCKSLVSWAPHRLGLPAGCPPRRAAPGTCPPAAAARAGAPPCVLRRPLPERPRCRLVCRITHTSHSSRNKPAGEHVPHVASGFAMTPAPLPRLPQRAPNSLVWQVEPHLSGVQGAVSQRCCRSSDCGSCTNPYNYAPSDLGASCPCRGFESALASSMIS